MSIEENSFFTVKNIDKAIKSKPDYFTHTLNDVILILLYSDRQHPLIGKIKQMAEIFLTMAELHILKKELVEFDLSKFGPYSTQVETAIDELLFLNYISAGGYKNHDDFSISIDERGIRYIKNIYEKLPTQTRELLSNKREEWDVFTSKGIVNYAYTHYSEYLVQSVFKEKYPEINWEDDMEKDE